MTQQIIEIGDLPRIAREQLFTLARLVNQRGETIVGYNNAHTPISKKLDEIKARVKGLPDGLYTVQFKNRAGKTFPVFEYAIQVGQSAAPGQVIQVVHQQPAESVRGWNEALADKERIATLQAELAQIKALQTFQQVEEEEDEEEEEAPLSDASFSGFKDIAAQFLPLADKYFELEERKIQLEEKRLQMGIYPGIQHTTRPQPQRRALRKFTPFRPLPEPGTDAFEKYLDYLERVPQAKFDEEMVYLQQNAPQVLEVVQVAFSYDSQNESQE